MRWIVKEVGQFHYEWWADLTITIKI